MNKFILGTAFLFSIIFVSGQQELNKQAIDSMRLESEEVVKTIKTVSYNLVSKQRIDGKYKESEVNIFVDETDVLKIRVDAISPDKAELVYIEGMHDNKVKVKKGITIFLSPYSYLLMRNSHTSINRASLKSTTAIFGANESKLTKNNPPKVNIVKGLLYKGIKSTMISMEFDYDIIEYTTKENESLESIAQSNLIPERRIIELNPRLNKNYIKKIKKGMKIKIPNAPAKHIVLVVDEKEALPIYIKAEDDEGLFSEHRFYNMKLNPKFDENKFIL